MAVRERNRERSCRDARAQAALVASLEASLRRAQVEYQDLEADYAELRRSHAEWENDHQALLDLNRRLAEVNAATAELMAELEEKNEALHDPP